MSMIRNDAELEVTQERILRFQRLLAQARQVESEANYRAMSAGFLSEIEKMQNEIRDYLSHLPEQATAT